MLYKDTNAIKDLDSQGLFEHILKEGMGNQITLASAPTTTGAELKPSEWAIVSASLYICDSDGTIIKYTGTAV